MTRAEYCIERIKKVLTPDLLKPGYRWMHDPENPTAGHCYIAAEALWHLLGGMTSRWRPMYAKEPDGMTHWWLVHQNTGVIADPTRDQYTFVGEEPPYHLGKRVGFLTKTPSRRASQIMERL